MHVYYWLRSRLIRPLAAVSAVALAMFLLWPHLVGPWHGPRLDLNLFLAWMPYGFALAAVAAHQVLPERRGLFLIPAALWLAFFPNAPYLVTDWRYLEHWYGALWYAVVMLTSFSIAGLMSAAVSLHLMHTVTAVRMGRVGAAVVTLTALGLSGFGVYLGRIVRLNSWDLFLDPRRAWQQAQESLHSSHDHPQVIGFCVLFTLLIGAVSFAVVELRRTDWSREEYQLWNEKYRRPHDRRSPGGEYDDEIN